MKEFKKRRGVERKIDFDPAGMREIALAYKERAREAGIVFEDDPFRQVIACVFKVLDSWDAPHAGLYRAYMGIAEEWGTAVIVQKMVFGNNSPNSITGVVHSHYLGYENIGLFGEYKTRAQGHDIVSGVARVFPISEEQRSTYTASSPFSSMERTYPEQYRKVYEAVKRIRYSTAGLLQYISPSLVFLTAVFMFHEPMDGWKLRSFAGICTALAIYSVSAFRSDATKPS